MTHLASAESDDQVGDECVLSLAGAVTHHGTPAVLLGQQMSLDTLRHGADLVHFQQKTVARLFLDSSVDTLGVGDGQVISHNLDTSNSWLSSQ